MGIDYDKTKFFGFIIEWDVMYEWMLNESQDDDSVEDGGDWEILQEWFEDQSFSLGNYEFRFIQAARYFDCGWKNSDFAFGIEAKQFDLDDMATLAKYTTLEGYDDLKPILDALGLHGEPSINALLHIN